MGAEVPLQAGEELPDYRVEAYNPATESENAIHHDDVAAMYGFKGGLVPGVTVYAYMTHPVVAAFGMDWLERGRMHARFLKPIYDGEPALVKASVEEASDKRSVLKLEVQNSDGDICAAGTATLPGGPPLVVPDIADYPAGPPAEPDARPPASYEALSAIEVMGSPEYGFHVNQTEVFLKMLKEELPIYLDEGVAHPGYLIQAANDILASNVKLPPWIHVSSDVVNYAAVRDGDRISVRGKVTELFDKKGHKFVRLDVLLVANESVPVMYVDHTAIYDVRKAD